MPHLRHFLLRHRHFAALLLVLALCLKAVVPAGYMVDATETGEVTLSICGGQANEMVKLAMPGKQTDTHDDRAQQADNCPYTALSFAAIGGAVPWLLEEQILFLLVLGFAPLVPLALRSLPYQRPPLRGPPTFT